MIERCGVPHPETEAPCMVKGMHAEHTSRGETGVDHWPNDQYRLGAEPHELIKDLSFVALKARMPVNTQVRP